MRYFDKIQHREWTDMALIMGPNVRWVEDDYRDLQRFYPEVLLGYRVLLATPETVARGALHGRQVTKAILLDGLITEAKPGWSYTFRDVAVHCDRVEWWHVHRGEGIWRVKK